MASIFEKLFARKSLMGAGKKKAARRPIRKQLGLEHLEDRLSPSVTPIPTYEWTGKGNDNLWSDGANWTNGGPASAGAGNHVDLVFHSNTLQETSSVDDIPSLPLTDSITFDTNNFSDPTVVGYNAGGTDTTGGYTFTGTGSITLDKAAGVTLATGLNPSGITETFDGPSISLSVPQTWTINDSVETLALTTNSNLNLGGNVLTLAGTGTLSLDGVVSGAAGSGFSEGTGTLILAGANTYLGSTNTTGGGFIDVQSNTGLGNAANTENLAGGGQIDLENGASPTMTGALTLDNAGLFGIGAETWSGPITLAAGTNNAISADGAGSHLTINGVISGSAASSLEMNASGTTEFKVNNTYGGETVVDAGNTLQIDAPAGLGAGGAGNETLVSAGSELVLAFTGTLQDAGGVAEQLILAGSGNGNSLGALQVLGVFSPTITGTVTLGGGATIGVGAGTLTISGVVSSIGATGVTFDDDGASGSQGKIVLSGANTYTGPTDIGGGTAGQTGVIVNIQNNTALGAANTPSDTVTVEDGAALQVQGSLGTIANNLVFKATAANFPTAATGSLENVSGSTTLSGQITLPNPTSAETTFAVDAGILTLTGVITGPEGAGTGGGFTLVGNPDAAPSLNPSSALVLGGTANNTYAGDTVVQSGILELDKTGGAFAVSSGTVTIGAANPVNDAVFNAEVLFEGTNEIATAANININPTGDLEENSFQQTIGALNMVGGEINLLSLGGDTLVLTKDVTATGYIDIFNQFKEAVILFPTTVVLNVGSAGAARTFNVTATPGKGAGDDDFILNAQLVDGTGSPSAKVLKTGTGEMVLDDFANGASTYTGGTEVQGGALEVETATSLGLGTSTVTVDSGASLVVEAAGFTQTLDLNSAGPGANNPNPDIHDGLQGGETFEAGAYSWAGNIVLSPDGGNAATIGAAAGSTLTLSGAISGSGGLAVQDAGAVTETNGAATNLANNYSGNTTVAAGAILNLNRQSTIAPNFPPLLAVPGNLDIFGTGNVDLGSSILNAYEIATSSTVTVEATGILNIGDAPAQQVIAALNGVAGGVVNLTSSPADQLTVTGPISITGTGTFTINGDGSAQSQFVTLGTAVDVFSIASGSTINLNVGLSGSGFTENGADTTSIIQLSGTAQNTEGDVMVNSGTLLLDKTAAFGTAGSSIAAGSTLTIGTGAGSGAVVRDIGANWQLGGITSGGANVVVNQDGLLDINGHMDRITGLTMSGGTVSLGTGTLFLDGSIQVNSNTTNGTSIITGTGANALNLDGATRTLTVASGANATISAAIVNGGLTKAGAGSATLTGANTYSGPTTVTAGILYINDNQPQSAATVQSGATLGGDGTVGNLTVLSGGTVAPGAGMGIPGVLTIAGSANLESGSSLNVLLNGSSAGSFSQLDLQGGSVNISGVTLNVTVNAAFPANTSFTIIQGGTVTGTTFANEDANGNIQTVNDGVLHVTVSANTVTLTTLSATTTTTVADLTQNPSVFEQPVTLQATVTFPAGTTSAGGTVTFTDTDTGTVTPNVPIVFNSGTNPPTGTATVTLNNLSVGPHNFVATYSGDNVNGSSNNLAAQPDGLLVTVNQANTTTTITSVSSSSTSFGQSVTIDASVSVQAPSTGTPIGPTGFVEFFATNTTTMAVTDLGQGMLNGNQASFTTSSLPPGSYTFTAMYKGDTNFAASAMSAASSALTVNQATTTVVLAAQPNPTGAGVPVTFTVTLTNTSSSSPPAGSVEMFDGSTDIGPATFVGSSGAAATYSFTTSTLTIGIHSIHAVYTSNGNFTSGPSNTVSEIVQPTVAAFVVGTDGSLRTVSPGQGLVPVAENPGPGAIFQVSAVTANGQAVVFAISDSGDTLWEHTVSGWTELSPAQFTQISAGTDANGNAVLFGVLAAGNPYGDGQTVFEYRAATGSFAQITTGSIAQVSAVGTPAGEVAYFIISSTVGNTGAANPYAGTLFRYDAANNPTFQVDHGFTEESSGSFSYIATGLASGGRANLYAVLSNGALYEQSPEFGTVGFNTGFLQLNTAASGLPSSFIGVAAEAQAVDKAFAVDASRTIYELTSSGTTHLVVPSASGSGVTQISAAQTPVGTDELFAVLQDGELWEYQSGTGASPAGFTQLLTGGANETSAP